VNTCTFAGRLVADAETKRARSGIEICSFRVASDCGWGDNKKTHWITCALFGERGTKLAPHLRKGDPVTVVGELSPPRTYEASGETRVAQDLIVREVALQGSSRGENSAFSQPRSDHGNTSGAGQGGAGSTGHSAPVDFDDDIPF
jgi:single-strand DNA-binding protein